MRLLDHHAQTIRCRQLWAATLNQAIFDIVDVGGTKGGTDALSGYGREALVWVMSQNNRPGSFSWVCEIVGMNPEWVRAKVLEMRSSPERRRKVADTLKANGRRAASRRETQDA